MYNRTIRGQAFSLIELMVVIAIISILAAIAIPSYKQYQIRSGAINFITILDGMAESALLQYTTTNKFPTSIVYGGVTVTVGAGWSNVNVGQISAINAYLSSDSLGFMLQMNVSGSPFNSIPGYVFSATTPSSYSALNVGVRDLGNGVIKTVCGQYPYGTQDVPLTYLPTSCQCASVSSFYTNGTGC